MESFPVHCLGLPILLRLDYPMPGTGTTGRPEPPRGRTPAPLPLSACLDSGMLITTSLRLVQQTNPIGKIVDSGRNLGVVGSNVQLTLGLASFQRNWFRHVNARLTSVFGCLSPNTPRTRLHVCRFSSSAFSNRL